MVGTEIVTFNWFGSLPAVVKMITPEVPLVNPLWDAVVFAVLNALLPTFSGMKTAPASAAASAAFWILVERLFHRLYSRPSPANAVRVMSVNAIHTMKKPRSGPDRSRTRRRKRVISTAYPHSLGRRRLETEHGVVGERDGRSEEVGHVLVVQLDVDAHRVPVRHVTCKLRLVRPTAAVGLAVSNDLVAGSQSYLMQLVAQEVKPVLPIPPG